MASNVLIWICLLVLICCSSTLAVDKSPNTMDLNKNPLSVWYKYYRMTKTQRRNVIMPRICYFSRITKSGIHQKLCLPYDDEN